MRAGRPDLIRRATAASTRSSRGGERHPHVLRAGGAVERAGRYEDAEVGEVRDGLPAVLVAGRPEVQRRLRVLDPEPCGPRAARSRSRRAAYRPCCSSAWSSSSSAAFIATTAGRASAGRGSCERRAAHRPAPGHRPRRRSGSRPGWSASTASGPRGCPRARPPPDVRVQHRDRRRLPGGLQVALVGDQDRAALAAHSTTLRRCSGGSTRPVGFDGEVEPQQRRDLRAERRQRVGRDRASAGERRAPPRTSGTPAPGRRSGRPAPGRDGPPTTRSAPWSRSPAARRSRPSPVTPCRRAEPVDAGLAQVGACRA